MNVRRNGGECGLECLGQFASGSELLEPFLELAFVGELTVKEQVGDLIKSAVVAKIIDSVSKVGQARAFFSDGADVGGPGDDAGKAIEKKAFDAKVAAVRLEKKKKEAKRAEALKAAKEKAKAKARVYVVKSGDSLSKIAKERLGDGSRWPEIFEANKDKIKDPNLIYPGQELQIPE